MSMIVKVRFSGDFWEYFLTSLVFLFLSAITVGILLPAWVYWSVKHFSQKMELDISDVELETQKLAQAG